MNTVLKTILISTVLFTMLAGASRTTVKAFDGSTEYMEYITISVDCTDASLMLACQLVSENETLVHYPSGVNMEDPHLIECLSITAMFNTTGSLLAFYFNGTDTGAARSNADAMKPSIDTAFGVTFTHLNTTALAGPPPYVVVIYTAEGVDNIASFTGTLKADCLASDIGGFSNVLETLVAQSADSTAVTLLAYNTTDKWAYTLMAMYKTTIPTGSDSHTINVLDLLGAGALGPSAYTEVTGTYMYSGVQVIISDTGLTFLSCEPAETMTPYTRGWYVPSHGPTTSFSGTFYWGSDPTLVEALNFTFGGQVIPEFSIFTLLFTLSAMGSAILLLRKRSALH